MGVRGLTTYVNRNQDAFLQQFFLHDSNLVIDGNGLCAQLYRSLNFFSAFGGDYDKFASYVRKFFKSIRKCKINPYVIFDGSYEARKLKTAFSRLRSKIYGASKLDPVTQGSLQIFPLLLRYVFKEILTEMKVPYTICEFEADAEIAAMARHLDCPVLSYDSDFFIYNVIYIPFNTLGLKPVMIEEDGITSFAFECKIYKVEFLTDNFGGLNDEMLPLMATLLGNDYVEKRVFKKFFSQLKLPKSRTCKNEQQRTICGVIKWLQNETLDSAIAKLLGRLKKNEKNKVFNIIKQSIASYKSTSCRSMQYFSLHNENTQLESTPQIPDSVNISDEDSSVTSSDISDDEIDKNESEDLMENPDVIIGISDWFADGIRNHTIPPAYFNLVPHHMHFCCPQAEDYRDEDSFLCTLPILRFAFDILTDFSEEHFVYICREHTNSYKRMFIGKEYSIPRPLEKTFPDLSAEQLNTYFYNFFNVKLPKLNFDDIRLLPADLQLFMLAILWWVAHCNVPVANIHSLFICYIMLSIIDEKTGSFRGLKYFNDKYAKKVEEIKKKNVNLNSNDDLFLNKNKISYEDSLVAASVLLKHFEIDDSVRKKPKSYDSRRIHSFAQFQCCLLQMNSLNILCGSHFETTKYHKCFNGTFVYNIALKLEKQIDPVHFLHQYINGAHSVLKFYNSLHVVYQSISDKMCLCTSKLQGKKKRRRKRIKQEDGDPNSFLVEGFEMNVTI
ncbi:protein asteroid-like [Amyelois transitella]|uniref:protein asteroid-like n=1 Tax=Amyelois transitella TaxID=680683 RepID=UPI0029906D53|nr:protein asteroid-like [Amyelois transitella]